MGSRALPDGLSIRYLRTTIAVWMVCAGCGARSSLALEGASGGVPGAPSPDANAPGGQGPDRASGGSPAEPAGEPIGGKTSASADACTPDWHPCSQTEECCSRLCAGNGCIRCQSAGQPCTDYGECCSGSCLEGACTCAVPGYGYGFCRSDADCCAAYWSCDESAGFCTVE